MLHRGNSYWPKYPKTPKTKPKTKTYPQGFFSSFSKVAVLP